MILDVLLLEMVLLLTFSLALGTWQRDPTTMGRLTFCALCIAVAATTLGELLTLRGLTSEVIGDRVKYAGILALPPLWVGFATHVSGFEIARRIPWFPLLLLVPGASLYAIMLDDRYGVLFMTTVEGGDDLYGSLWQVYVVYGYSLALCGSAILATTVLRRAPVAKTARRLALTAASLVPVLGNSVYIRAQIDWPYDPTPLFLGLALLALRSAVFEGGLVEPLPVSQRELIHQLPLGVIVTERNGDIVEISDVAANRLDVFEEFALGRNVSEVLGGGCSTRRTDWSGPIYSEVRGRVPC